MKKYVIFLIVSVLASGIYAEAPVITTAIASITTNIASQGALPALFSVSATEKVFFSQGNLQFNAALGTHATADGKTKSGTWQFAEHQYDYIGSNNTRASSSYNGWVDVFMWATSGWAEGGMGEWEPWSSIQSHSKHFIHGDYTLSMTGENNCFADWGVYNAISNGGNAPKLWRTLTYEEMNYLLSQRDNASSKRGYGTINGTYGLILLPDEWELPDGCSFSSTSNTTYSLDAWAKMEIAGAVFLPVSGCRTGGVSTMKEINENGYYWTATPTNDEHYIYVLSFSSNTCTYPASGTYRDIGYAVRLVCSSNTAPSSSSALISKASFKKGNSEGIPSDKAKFKVGNNKYVYFSKGNLQYRASNGTSYPKDGCLKHEVAGGGEAQGEWRFAPEQYQLGDGNNNRSGSNTNWIDVFSWGASGATVNPWVDNNTHASGTMDGTNLDWGVYNAISNGGNKPGIWRNMTESEWTYFVANNNKVKCSGAGASGYVFFPIEWSQTYVIGSSLSHDDWKTLESSGAIFLPYAGCYYSGSFHLSSEGNYWTSTWQKRYEFHNSQLNQDAACQSVRLVMDEDKLGSQVDVIGGYIREQAADAESRTIVATANTGYEFICWGDGVATNPRTLIGSDMSAEMVAYFKNTQFPNEVTVTWTDVDQFTISSGTSDCAPFQEWSNGDDNTSITYNLTDGDIYPIYDMVVYNTMSQAAEGGTIAISPSSCSYDLVAQAETGFSFYKWQDLDMSAIDAQQATRNVPYEEGEYKALFCKNFTMTFEEGEHATNTIDPIESYILEETPEVIAESGYRFDGWSLTEGEGNAIISYPFYPAENVSLYAQYAFIGEATITFHDQGHGTLTEDAILNTTNAEPITLPDVTPKDCYNFLGWARNEDAMEAEYEVGNDYIPYQAATDLYAVYEDKPTLYHQNLPTVPGVVNIVEGDCEYTLTAVANPGYTFYRWADTKSTDPVRTVGYVEQTYGAQFAKIWKVTLKDAHIADEIVEVFDGCNIPTQPARTPLEGYVFCGWATTDNTSTPDIQFPYSPDNDITLYAVYRQKPGDVIIDSPTQLSDLSLLQVQAPFTNIYIQDGGELTITETSAETQLSLGKVTINGGGKLDIPTGTFVTIDELIMNGGDADANDNYLFIYPQLIANGTLNVRDNVIYYDYLLNKKQQYALCLPIDVNLSEITYADGTSAEYGNAYKIATYDGAARAQGATGWQYLSNGTTSLQAGKGYTVFASPLYYQYQGSGTMLQYKYSRLRFPMHITANYTEQEKQISVSAHAAAKPNDAGWNLLGNPYFANYSAVGGLNGNNGIHLLTLQGDGSYIWTDNQRYVVIPSNDGKAYASVLASAAEISSFGNFFVQIGNGDAITMDIANRAQNVVARHLTPVEETMTGIVLTGASSSDKMGVLLGEDYTEDYEINADLQKFGHNAGVNVYAYVNNNELAFVAVNEAIANNAIPVGFIAPNSGKYTFSLDESYDNSKLVQVLLYDSQLKVATDLLQSNYEFSTTQGMNNTRFLLSIRKVSGAATALDKVKQTETDGKYIFNNMLLIKHNGRIFNAQGAVMR